MEQTHHIIKNARVYMLVFLGLIFYPIYQRFVGSAEMGISGADAFWYWHTAFKWANGIFHTELHYRPLAHILNAFGLKIFGFNDYALKFTTASLDCINIILILLLSRSILKSNIISFLPAIIYAYHPDAIKMSHHELVHIATMTFILPSVFAFQKFLTLTFLNNKIAKRWLFVSGLFLAMSGHIHPEVNVHASLFVLFIMLKNRELSRPYETNIIPWVTGFISVFAFFFILLGPLTVIGNIMDGANFQHGAFIPRTFFQELQRFISGQYIYLKGVGSTFLAFLVYSSLILMLCWKFKFKKKHPLIIYFMWALFLGQMFLCLILVSRNLLPRLFFPFMPLFLVILFYIVERFSGWRKKKVAKNWISIIISFIIIASLGYSFEKKEYNASYQKAHSKVIKDHFSEIPFVIIGPILTYNIGKGYNFKLYFDEKAEYLYFLADRYRFDNPKEGLTKYITTHNVTHLILNKKGTDRRMIKDPAKLPRTIKALRNIYAMTPDEYSEENEILFWNDLILNLKAKKIYDGTDATIYEFPHFEVKNDK